MLECFFLCAKLVLMFSRGIQVQNMEGEIQYANLSDIYIPDIEYCHDSVS